MIKNSLKYTKIYENLSKNMKIGLDYIKNKDLTNFANGKYQINGEEVYINIQDYNSKPLSEGKWEAHKKYADIQFVIKGEEKIGVGDISEFTTLEPYSAEKDLEFLQTQAPQDFLTLKENDFIILYPQDVHMPQICVNTSSYVKKAVVKVAL